MSEAEESLGEGELRDLCPCGGVKEPCVNGAGLLVFCHNALIEFAWVADS